MKKIKFKGKVVVCVKRKNGKWGKWEEKLRDYWLSDQTFSGFPLSYTNFNWLK
jgi:hypothetical protein